MIGNPVIERAAIEAMYEDTCSILRAAAVKTGNLTQMQPQQVATGIRCALSRASVSPSVQMDAENRVEYTAKVFMAPDVDVQAGDIIDVTRFGSVVHLECAGRPAVYATHQEIGVKERGLA